MPRWIKRCLWAVVLGGALPTGVMAQGDPAGKPAKAPQVVVNADPYRAATPYNGTVVGRPVPAAHWNMTNFTLGCDLPNQNLDGYVAGECGCGWGHGGCGIGCDNGCGSFFNRFGGCGNACDSGCGSLFNGWRLGNGCDNACGNTCSSPCTTTCTEPCKSSCELLSGWKSNNCCTSNCAPACQPACNTGCRQVQSNCNTCDSGCGNIFGWKFRYKDNCNSCTTGCNNSCNACDSGCGSLFSGWRDRFSFGCKKDACDDCCDQGYRGWFRWNGGCGCCSPCNGGCGSATPATTPAPVPVQPKTMPATEAKPVSYIEPVAFWNIFENHKAKKERAEERENGCLNCPPHGPTPKHTLPRASTLGCTGCGTFESEAVFLFGSCRQFFGEPTWKWMHGK